MKSPAVGVPTAGVIFCFTVIVAIYSLYIYTAQI